MSESVTAVTTGDRAEATRTADSPGGDAPASGRPPALTARSVIVGTLAVVTICVLGPLNDLMRAEMDTAGVRYIKGKTFDDAYYHGGERITHE